MMTGTKCPTCESFQGKQINEQTNPGEDPSTVGNMNSKTRIMRLSKRGRI